MGKRVRVLSVLLVVCLVGACGSIRDSVGCCSYKTEPPAVERPEQSFLFEADGEECAVFVVQGSDDPADPPILLLHELPGLTKRTVKLANRIANSGGYTVYVPLLFGDPLEEATFRNSLVLWWFDCDWRMVWSGTTSPKVDWLRALANEVSDRHEGSDIGVVGMCLTGAFPIALLSEDVVVAPVVCQPSLPIFHCFEYRKADLGLCPEDIAHAQERMEKEEDLEILGFRFELDSISPMQRFCTLEEAFGDRFLNRQVTVAEYVGDDYELDEDAHSVLTEEWGDSTSHPSYRRFWEMLEFFRTKLHPDQ